MSLVRKDRKGLKLVGEEGEQILEGKFRAIFESASDAILTVKPDGEIDAANTAFSELSGYRKTELRNAPIVVFIPNQKVHRIPDRARPFFLEMLERPGTYEDIAIVTKDATVRLADVSVRKIEDKDASLCLVILRDVTEKKRMERELITKHSALKKAYVELERTNVELQSMQDTLIQAGKMAALGELTAGIAHELNQPLMGIRGYAQELQAILGDDLKSTPKAFFQEIIKNADKMAKIILYLRTFTSKSVDGFEKVDLHEVIDDSLKILDHQFKVRGIEVDRNYGVDIPQIYANPVQLEQVFINLATNARDAIEATGRGRGQIRIKTRKKDHFVEVFYADDGCGMNEKTKSKMMNPFFTTKEVGKGMGLGMSLSYGILNKFHGSMVVQSEWGRGTEFQIRLPEDFRELV